MYNFLLKGEVILRFERLNWAFWRWRQGDSLDIVNQVGGLFSWWPERLFSGFQYSRFCSCSVGELIRFHLSPLTKFCLSVLLIVIYTQVIFNCLFEVSFDDMLSQFFIIMHSYIHIYIQTYLHIHTPTYLHPHSFAESII